jgi:hypothetical protein
MNCQQCPHNRICEFYHNFDKAAGRFCLIAKDDNSYALFMSSLRTAKAECCKHFQERQIKPDSFRAILPTATQVHEMFNHINNAIDALQKENQ